MNLYIRDLASSDTFLLMLSVVLFYGACLLMKWLRLKLLHPIMVASLGVIYTLNLLDIDYDTYYDANEVLIFLLNLSVVCLGYLMHKHIDRIKEYRLSLMLSTFVGSVVGIVSVWALCTLFGCDDTLIRSFLPKSITSAIALNLSESIGGIPSITMLAVVCAGVSGSIMGPNILRFIGVSDPIAIGAALGSASHAVGTARALEMGAVEGAVGSAAICLMGLFTSVLIPLIYSVFT